MANITDDDSKKQMANKLALAATKLIRKLNRTENKMFQEAMFCGQSRQQE